MVIIKLVSDGEYRAQLNDTYPINDVHNINLIFQASVLTNKTLKINVNLT